VRENRTHGSEGGGAGYSTGPSYPYPQVVVAKITRSPEGATDRGCVVSRSHHLLIVCRRFAAGCFC